MYKVNKEYSFLKFGCTYLDCPELFFPGYVFLCFGGPNALLEKM